MDSERIRRDQFTFYRSYYEALKVLPKRDQVSVVLAICAYALDAEEPALSGVPLSVFTLIRPTLDSGRNKARNRINKTSTTADQTNNKPTTTHQQNNNKPDQTGKEKEGEKEGEREGENDSSLPPCPPSRGTPTQKAAQKKPPEADWGWGPELTEAFRGWLRYKQEKRQGYKPEGLRALVTETRHNVERYGEAQVAALIRKCMSANWQGIIWDRLERMPAGKQAACDKDVAWMRKYVDQRKREEDET